MTTNEPPTPGPESLCERFVASARAGDLDGILALYAADAVVSLPRGREAAGAAAVRAAYAAALASGVDVTGGGIESARALVVGDLAVTSVTGVDGQVRTQVARRGPDGGWVWIRDGRHLCDVEAALGAVPETAADVAVVVGDGAVRAA